MKSFMWQSNFTVLAIISENFKWQTSLCCMLICRWNLVFFLNAWLTTKIFFPFFSDTQKFQIYKKKHEPTNSNIRSTLHSWNISIISVLAFTASKYMCVRNKKEKSSIASLFFVVLGMILFHRITSCVSSWKDDYMIVACRNDYRALAVQKSI